MCVIGDYAKAGVGGIFLHDAAERHLCGRCHCVGFIEDDELVGTKRLKVPRLGSGGKDLFCASEAVSMVCDAQSSGQGGFLVEEEQVVLAKVLICSRTTSMPLSSLALSSRTICRMFLLPYIRLASAKIVDVLPVPGGP